jgi:hypothetical protein
LENLDKLTLEENYLPEQMFNMDETSLLWTRTPVITVIQKKAKSMPGFKVSSSTPHDDRTTMKSPATRFSERIPVTPVTAIKVYKGTGGTTPFFNLEV